MKINILNVLKKIYPFFMSVILVLCIVTNCLLFNVNVYAEETETPTSVFDPLREWGQYLYWTNDEFRNNYNKTLGNWILSACETTVDYASGAYEAIINRCFDALKSSGNMYSDEQYTYINANFTAEIKQMLRDTIDEYIQSQAPYKTYTFPNKKFSEVAGTVYTSTDTQNNMIRASLTVGLGRFQEADYWYENGATTSALTYMSLDFNKYKYAYLSDEKYNNYYTIVKFVDSGYNDAKPLMLTSIKDTDGNVHPSGRSNIVSYEDIIHSMTNCVEYSDTFTNRGYKYYLGINGNNVYFNCNSDYSGTWGGTLQIFNSYADMVNYTAHPIAYTTSNYIDNNYNDTIINNETLNNFTTENVMNIYNTINNTVGDTTNTIELQKVIDETFSKQLEELNKTLEEVEDNTADTNTWLQKIFNQDKEFYNNFSSWSKSVTEYLKKIYDQDKEFFENFNKDFKTLLEDIANIKDNVTEIKDNISNFLKVLEEIRDNTKNIYDVVSQGFDDLFDEEEEDNTYYDLMSAENFSVMFSIFLYGITPEQEENVSSISTYYSSMSEDMTDDSDLYNISGYGADTFALSSSHSHSSTIRDQYGGVVGYVSHKFPFCIPFDIYDMFNLFVEEPETPVIKIPFNVRELGQEFELVIDLKYFDEFSGFSRSLFTLFMMYGLLVFTRKYIIG